MSSLTTIEVIEKLDILHATDSGLINIKAPNVWSKTMGEGVKVMSIDTGIDMTHRDLKDRVRGKMDIINKSSIVTDEYGHGTHIAGLLVGESTGVAPNADLYIAKVLNQDGLGMIVDVLSGISYAMQNKVDVLCLSLGVPNDLPLILKQKIIKAYESGITIVSAVGNSGDSQALYPARMDEVIGVGGLDKEFKLAKYSNRGYDVLAPSEGILSTYKNGTYARMTGTSMASALVAGAVTLLISYYRKQGKELKPKEIKRMLSETIDLTELIK